jgi:hypothetical protein
LENNLIKYINMFNKINKFVPLINLLIGSVALTFQVTVLYPWHNELDKKFDQLIKNK